MNNNRILGYDLTRSFAVIFVFIAHVVLAQTQNSYLFAFYTSISPGITMSLLGFISACLLVNGKDIFSKYPTFLFRRLTRILIPVFLVLTFALILVSIYGLNVNKEHLIYHYLGLSLFFDWFRVSNEASIGWGLWFVTAILIMYILLPIIHILFTHKNGLLHLIVYCVFCILLHIYLLPPETSFWNVAASFGCGVYVSGNNWFDKLIKMKPQLIISFSIILLGLCLLSTFGISPFDIRLFLYPIYPVVLVPLFFFISSFIPNFVGNLISKFSEISFEFYMLQFYFINSGFDRIFGPGYSIGTQLIISFLISTIVAYILSILSKPIRKGIENYFLK